MPKDYKDRVPNSWRGPRRRRKPVWVWLVPVLVLFGGAGTFALITHQRSTAKDEEASGPVAGSLEKADPNAKAASRESPKKPDRNKGKKPGKPEAPPDIELPEPRFTFYKILPEKEVIVSERDIASLKRDEKAGKAAVPGGFVIQVGAYSKLEDAEKTRARLGEAKVKGKMEKVLIDKATWYRVKLGPYSTLAEAEKIRAQLRKHRIDSVLQQSKTVR
jgi:cell division protein FtsN